MLKAFEFDDDGRKFTCRVEIARGALQDAWWWFGVSTDDRHRYAPFRAEAEDTEAGVRGRVLAYYTNLLERRAMPATAYWRRGERPAAGAPPVAPNGSPTTPGAPA